MTDLYDTLVNPEEQTEEEYLAGYQELIDSGQAWRLEGSVGRQAMALIEAGRCTLGPKPVRDTYDNVVPAAWMVEAGSKGSYEFCGREAPEPPSREEQDRLCAEIGLVRS